MRVKINHGGKTYHIDWDKSVPPTKEEARKIADDLLSREAEQNEKTKPLIDLKDEASWLRDKVKSGWDEVKYQLSDLEPLTEGVGDGLKWLTESPEFLNNARDRFKELTTGPKGPRSDRPMDRVNFGNQKAQEGFRNTIADLATPSRLDIATLGLAGAAKAAPKILSEGGKLLEAAGDVRRSGELGAEAGVFKFGKNTGSPKPRWKNFELSFASDEDKAAYILAGKGESKAHQAILAQAQKEGLDVEELLERGMKIRQTIKKSEGSATGTSISVPSHGKGTRLGGTNPRSKGKNPRALKANPDQELEDAVNQIADGSIEKAGDDVVLSGDKLPPTQPPAENVLEDISSGPESVSDPDEKLRWKDALDLLGPFQRSVQSMGEMSRPLRQAKIPTLLHPFSSGPAFKNMFKAAVDPDHVSKVMAEVDARPFANIKEFKLDDEAGELSDVTRNLYREAGLRMSDLKEAFPSGLAEKIPGLKQITKRSEAAYQAYGDTLLPNEFDRIMKKYGYSETNLPDNETLRQIGNTVNTLAGSGGGGKFFEQAVPTAQKFLYSPRYQKSQADLLNPWNYGGSSKRFGDIGAKELRRDVGIFGAGAAGGIAGIDALSDDVDVTWNPLDSDFAKVRVGDTRFNPIGAMNPLIRTGARTAKNLGNLAFGDDFNELIEPLVGEEAANKKVDLGFTLSNFARSKLAPGLATLGGDIAFGQGKDSDGNPEIRNVIGEPLRDENYFGKNFETPYLGHMLGDNTPLYYQELGEIANSDNPELNWAAAPLGFFGADSSTYKKRETSPSKPKGKKSTGQRRFPG